MDPKIATEETIRITNTIEEMHVKLEMDVGDVIYADIVNYAETHLTEAQKQNLLFDAGFKILLEAVASSEVECTNGQLAFDFDK